MSTTISIADLHANVINCSVKGLIIGKSNMSTFPKRTNGQQEPSLGSVVKFLIRDSCEDYINLTVWGSQQFIETYDQQFTIGHVINVLRCTIGNIRQDERFSPITSSQYQLTINEGIGLIELNEDDDGAKIAKLINVPLKSLDLALNLADIITNRPTSDWLDLVDLVVVVAKLKPTKQSGTKNVRDLIVIDQTLPGMFLTIWNGAWIDKSNSWSEMTTILHLINVGFKYSDFHKSIVLVALSRTIIVVDPIGERATSLRQYTKNSTLILSDIDTSEPDLSTIQTVMTIQQIIDRLNDPASDSVFYSLTYAIVTQMDLDGCTLISSRRCIHCNCQIKSNAISCDKENCSLFFAESPLEQHFINYFNVPVDLTDHTGTLKCRLVGDAAERVLGIKLVDFQKLSTSDRSAIKWKFLMERCAVKLSIKRKTTLRWKQQINIVDCYLADTNEVFEKIKAY